MGKLRSGRWNAAIYLLLIAITFAAYLPTLRNGFTSYDDTGYVTDNLHVQQGLTARSIIWAFTPGSIYPTDNWHPLTWLSIMLDCQIFHLNPMGHHLTSLLIHVANTLLLFLVLMLMTGSRWRSAFVAALFAVHPLHVESVAWVSERKDVLSGFFWLLTMLAYLSYAKKPCPRRYLLVAVLFTVGLLCKPMLVTLPIVLLLMDYWPLQRFLSRSAGMLIMEKVPLLVISAAASAVTLSTQSSTAMVHLADMSLPIRLANAAVAYIAYLVKMMWPRGLAAFYPHPGGAVSTWQAVGSAALLVAGLVLAFRLRKQAPCILAGWLWYLVTLIPVIGLVQVGQQGMADRYTYLPLIGIFIVIAWSIPDLLARRLAAVGGILVAVLMACTWQQVSYWHDTRTLFEHALTCTQRNYVAYDMVGSGLAAQGKFSEAAGYFRKAIDIRPGDPAARTHLGLILLSQNRLPEAEAEFRAALEGNSDYVWAQRGLGALLAQEGRLSEAVDCFNEFLRRLPDDPRANFVLGQILAQQGQPDDAIAHLSRAVESEPRFADARTELGNILAAMGRSQEAADQWSEAARLWSEAIKHRPKDSTAYLKLAKAMQSLGQLPEAIQAFRQTLKLDPESWQAANELAFIYATEPNPDCRNPAEAVRLAEMASRLTHNKQSNVLDTLAAAYAAAGRYKLAVAAEERALALASTLGQGDRIARMRHRLSLYQSHRPWMNAPRPR